MHDRGVVLLDHLKRPSQASGSSGLFTFGSKEASSRGPDTDRDFVVSTCHGTSDLLSRVWNLSYEFEGCQRSVERFAHNKHSSETPELSNSVG